MKSLKFIHIVLQKIKLTELFENVVRDKGTIPAPHLSRVWEW